MSSLKRGFLFSKLAMQAGLKLPGVWKILGAYSLGVLFFTLFVFVPIGLMLAFLGTGFLGMALIGGCCVLLIFAIEVWAEINLISITRRFDAQQTGKILELKQEKIVIKTGWRERLKFTLAYPSLSLAVWLRKQSKVKSNKSTEKQEGKLWLDGLYLVEPLLSIEELKLGAAVTRIKNLVAKNLLRFDPELVRVKHIGNAIALISLITGCALGVFTGLSITGEGIATLSEKLLSAGVGLVFSSLIASIGIGINGYLRTIYNVNIYRWMVDVDIIKGKNTSKPIEPPIMLSKVLNK